MKRRFAYWSKHVLIFACASFLGPFAASAVLVLLAVIISMLTAGAGLILLVIIAFSIGLGAKYYVMFGLPVFALCALLGVRYPFWYLVAGLAAHAISIPFLPDVIGPTQTVRPDAGIRMISQWGWFFAPVWGFGFGVIYYSIMGERDDVR